VKFWLGYLPSAGAAGVLLGRTDAHVES